MMMDTKDRASGGGVGLNNTEVHISHMARLPAAGFWILLDTNDMMDGKNDCSDRTDCQTQGHQPSFAMPLVMVTCSQKLTFSQ